MLAYSGTCAVLRLLMDEHGLTGQSDKRRLPEVGSQGVVSEILRGRRQIKYLPAGATRSAASGSGSDVPGGVHLVAPNPSAMKLQTRSL